MNLTLTILQQGSIALPQKIFTPIVFVIHLAVVSKSNTQHVTGEEIQRCQIQKCIIMVITIIIFCISAEMINQVVNQKKIKTFFIFFKLFIKQKPSQKAGFAAFFCFIPL